MRLFIVTPEQFFRNSAGHYSRWGEYIRDPRFGTRINIMIVDEAHCVATQGIAQYGLPAFRPAYGRLNELHVILGPHFRTAALNATAPPHVHKVICDKILHHNYVLITASSNRPNTIYATHTVVGGIKNLSNFDCFIQYPFNLSLQPRILIFRENADATVDLASHLNKLLPLEFRDRGVVRHYHSNMSCDYLTKTHAAFVEDGGDCRVLVATSAESTVSTCIITATNLNH